MPHYILKDHDIVCVSFHEWAQWFENADRTVASTEIDDVRVSTIFLGLDHNLTGKGPPLLFETMIFGGPLDQEQWRYATWEEARDGHDAACTAVRHV